MLGECIVVDYDSHGETHVETRKLRGRKEYRCCECHRVIPKSVRHERATYVGGDFDGWCHVRTCELCVSVRNSLFKGGYVHEELWERIRDHFGDSGLVGCDESWLDPPTHPIVRKPEKTDQG